VKSSLESSLISVWRQAMVENADAVKLGTESYPVTNSKAKRLRLVAFVFDGNEITGMGSSAALYWASSPRTSALAIRRRLEAQ
jgi:hypothetical protein